jgi:hypothetical protein
MALTYTEKTNEIGWSYIEMLDSNKPESICYIPIDPANSDYQAYLNKDKAEQSTPMVTDETATL